MFKSVKKRYSVLLLAFVFIMQIISPVAVREAYAASTEKKIQILGTSDLHGRFYPWEYASDTELTKGSMAKISTKIKELRKTNPNTILIDCGDTIQDNSSQLFLNDDIHPMILGMNEMKYDTYTLGNHEFNYGIPALEKALKELNGPKALCGNVYKPDGSRLADAYRIVERDGLKIAIIGMVTPHITKWDGPNLKGYTVNNPITETQKAIAEIKKNGGADLFVAVLHMGQNSEYGNGDSAKEVAIANPEISAIVCGHEHAEFVNVKAGNAIIVEPKSNGEFLSQIELKVKEVDGKYQVVEQKSANIAIDDKVAIDKALATKFESYHQKALTDARQVIGELKGGSLAPADEFKGITQAQIQDTAVVDLILDTQMYYAGKHVPKGAHHVSGAAIFTSNANIAEGPIKKADTSKVYKYDNTLMTLKVNGAQLKKYMEWSAGYYNTFKPGDLTISFNEKIRMYNYDMFGGVKYEVNISKAAGQRIENLTYIDGAAVKDTDVIYLTVNNYRANTQLLNQDSGLFKGEKIEVIYDSASEPVSAVRDLIGKYIVEVKGASIKSELDNNWKVTGYSFNKEKREIAQKLVNEGKLSIPASADGRTPNVRSITWQDVEKLGKGMTFLTFNDYHGAVDSKNSSKDPGIAKFAGAIKSYTSKSNKNMAYSVVSAGDIYQGTAMSNLTYGDVISKMLKEIKVEASAIGNHEFDWDINKVGKWSKDGGFDFLAANLYDKNTGKPVNFAKPYKVIDKNGIKVALIGLITPETATQTLPANVENFEFKDPIESTNYWTDYISKNEKVDAVVVLSHLGAFQDSNGVITGEAADLAKNAKGIDGIICGHTHQTVAGEVNGVPIVQAKNNGRNIGQLSLVRLDGKLYVSAAIEDLSVKVKDLPEDPATKAIYDKYSKDLGPTLDKVVTVLENDFPHDRHEGLSILGQFNAKLMKEITGTQIGITNGGGIRGPLSKGNLTVGNMYGIFPFDNTLVTMELSGADIKKNLEHGINNKEYGWIQYYGMKVDYDEAKPQGERVTGIELMDGNKIQADKYYTVVTNDFMATGGDGYNFKNAKNMVNTNIVMRDAMIKELSKYPSVKFVKEELLILANKVQKITSLMQINRLAA